MNLTQAVERLFTPASRPGRVGAEVELIPVTDTARPRPVPPGVLQAAFDAAFIEAAAPTFEPGGQLELSPAPRSSASALIHDLNLLVDRANRLAARRGVRLEAVGVTRTTPARRSRCARRCRATGPCRPPSTRSVRTAAG